MPRWLIYTVVVLVVLSWIPLALIARARVTTSTQPRIHPIQDMDDQQKYKPQSRNALFADLRAMRPDPPGTVARGERGADSALELGRVGGDWVSVSPVPVTMSVLERGRERYDVFCSPCHGLAGYGDGAISRRADELQEGTWTPPSSFHTDLIRTRPDGHLYNTIAYGIRSMPGYGSQIEVGDRWAIVAYVRALQRSQNATIDDVPPELRTQLR